MVPNAEQTASLISLVLYSFLDPVVYAAYKTPSFGREQMPPLADYDQASVLVNKSFPLLYPFSGGKKGHIFWGLMRVFRTYFFFSGFSMSMSDPLSKGNDYLMLALMLVVHTCAGLAGPIGINRLLRFLETDGEGATVKPWVWIVWLLVAPIVGSMSLQWYIFVAVRLLFSCVDACHLMCDAYRQERSFGQKLL